MIKCYLRKPDFKNLRCIKPCRMASGYFRRGFGLHPFPLILLTLLLTMTNAQAEATLADLKARLDSDGTAESLLFLKRTERQLVFAHMSELYPTRVVPSSTAPYPLPKSPQPLSDVTYSLLGETHNLADFLARPEHRGLIVVRDGHVTLEHYAAGHTPETRWVSFSVTKSVTSLLIGAAIQAGYIDSLEDPIARYLPRLQATPYAEASIKNLLQMSSGIAWNEDYADPASDVARAGAANGLALANYLSQLPRVAPAGTRFNYNTGETNLAGELLRAAIGNNAATFLSNTIWQPFGMSSDANWLLGAPGGGETGGCCISATLRDYARLGLFVLTGGTLPDGEQVLPTNWITESITPSAAFAGYGYFWWLAGDGRYSAQGIFGQHIFIDPAQNLVIAVHSNEETAVDSLHAQHLVAVIERLSKAP